MPFIHSEAAPIGHSTPHQLRPVTSTDRKTSGNHKVQIRNRAVSPIARATSLAGSTTGAAISTTKASAIAT